MMNKRALKVTFTIVFLLLLILLITDYFNRQGISSVFSLSSDNEISQVKPFNWNFDSADEVSVTSDTVSWSAIDNSNLVFKYKDSAHIGLNQLGQDLNIYELPYVVISFFSNKSGVLNIRILKESENGLSRNIISEPFYFTNGWNRIQFNFLYTQFFEDVGGGKLISIDWEKESFNGGRIRLDFQNDEKGENYILLDFVRFLHLAIIEFTSDNVSLWAELENIRINGNFEFESENKDKTGEIKLRPLGFNDSVNSVAVRFLNKENKPLNIGLIYRKYLLDPFGQRKVVLTDWISHPVIDNAAYIGVEGSVLLECRVLLLNSNGNKNLGHSLDKIIFEYSDTELIRKIYSITGLNNAPPLEGERFANEEIESDRRIYKTIPIQMSKECYDKINFYKAKGYAVIGLIDSSMKITQMKELLSTFRNFVFIWAVKNNLETDGVRLDYTTHMIGDLIPGARVIKYENSAREVRERLDEFLKEGVDKNEPAYLIFDRGLLFYFALVITGFLGLYGIRKTINLSFAFRVAHIKYFGICLIISVALLLPLIYILGLGQYRYVSFAALIAGIYRYLISAFIQELFRVIAIEYIYRYSFKKFKEGQPKYILALVLTSIFFSLGHLGYPGLDFSLQLSFMLVTFFAGLVFGYLYIKTKSITPPFILHLIANIFLFVFTTMGSRF
ncbi:MAG: CPBP family intramembrane metalloprotease [Acidobacteria bacterium]|nr:CPBP family intramembrane metalloprotease [Acidobacteriota bacterium]